MLKLKSNEYKMCGLGWSTQQRNWPRHK